MVESPQQQQPPKKESWLVNLMARFLIFGEKLGPFLKPLIWAVVIIVVLFVLGIFPRLARNRRLAAESQAETKRLPSVTIVKVERSPAQLDLILPGNIEAVQQTQLSARTTGYVKRYFADIGDRVKAGQILAEIDTPEVDQQAQQAAAELARAQATVAQSTAQLAQQGAAQQTARANAARANADLSRSVQTTQQQRAQLREARANAELARVTWTRWRSLVSGGAISKQEADEKEAAYNSAMANVSSLEAALRAANADVQAFKAALTAAQADVTAAGENVKAYREAVNAARAGVSAAQSNLRRFSVLSGFRQVRAPYDGVVIARNVDEGALISTGGAASSSAGATSDSSASSSSVTAASSGSGRTGNTGLFTLARVDDLRIYVDVPQTDASNIHPGQSAEISVKELPKQTFDGLVGRTSNALDQSTRTLRAEIVLPNQQGVLLPGMYAQVKLTVMRQHPSILIPSGALISDARGNRVATVADGKVAFHKVEIGRDFGESLEITDGLKEGENAVTNPSDELQEGGKVAATKAKPPKDDASGGGAGTKSKDGGKSAPGGSPGPTDKPKSPNDNAIKQMSKQGFESNEPRAQPGGAEREQVKKSSEGKKGS